VHLPRREGGGIIPKRRSALNAGIDSEEIMPERKREEEKERERKKERTK
jgi:hypothetical protein